MDLTFYGATGTVTGSKSLLEIDGLRVLVDCGMFQGFKALRERNWSPLPFDPASLDAVLLTHAHIDHSGCLPLLMRHGYRGPIWTTAATADLCDILLHDTAHLQEEEARYRNKHHTTKHDPAQPLYTVADAERCLKHIQTVPSHGDLELADGVRASFRGAGHILGAASIHVQADGRSVLFSGDLGRDDDLVMRPPEAPPAADAVVIESTYGDRLHPDTDPIERLGDVVRRTAARGGMVIVPAFAVGRTQGLLYALYRLKQARAIPDLPIVLDSPMGIAATQVYLRHLDDHRLTAEECQGIAEMTRFVRSVDDSKALLQQRYPMVVIAGSGMVTGGRVLHHILHRGPHSRNSIVLGGFQAGGTRGASLVAGAASLKMFGEYVPVRAEVVQIEGLSAHADQHGLLDWLGRSPKAPGQVLVTHGEPQAADTLRLRIEERFGWRARVPDYRQTIRVG